jgi:hypothetical protein
VVKKVCRCAYQHGDPAEDVEGDEPLPRGCRRRRSGGRALGGAGLEVVAPDELVPAHGARRSRPPTLSPPTIITDRLAKKTLTEEEGEKLALPNYRRDGIDRTNERPGTCCVC